MRARDFFLALLIIAAGLFLTYAKSGRFDDWTVVWNGPWFGSTDEFAYEETREIAGPVPAELRVQNAHGIIEIAATGGTDKAVVTFKKRIRSRNRTEADKVAADLRMTVAAVEGRLVLGTNREEFKRRNFSTDFKIVIPPATSVVVKNSYGLVRIEGAGKSEIENPHGDVTVLGSAGPLTVVSSYSRVEVDGVRGEARISAPHADVDVRNVDGAVDLDHSYGSIGLDRIGRRTVVKGNHSEITAQNLAGEAEIASSYERITVAAAKSVKVRAHHCDIEARDIDGAFDLENSYGQARLNRLTGDLRIDGQNIAVSALDLGSGKIFVRTSNENVTLSGFSGPAEAVLTHSVLTLEPAAALSGPVDVQGEYVDVLLSWPAGFRAPFEGRTRNGRILWNLADKPDSETSNGTTELFAYSSATGKPKVKIATAHADIRVEPAGR